MNGMNRQTIQNERLKFLVTKDVSLHPLLVTIITSLTPCLPSISIYISNCILASKLQICSWA